MSPLSWYSRWDGSQRLDDLDADQLLDAMSDDLLSDGDPWSALRRLFQRGAKNPDGANLPGLQDLLNRLRRQRQQQLDRYDLSSVLDDIKQKLDAIMKTEREGIERRVADAKERAQKGEAPESFKQAMEQAAAEHRKTLDEMPESPAGRIQGLQNYEFMDPDAHRLFWELMKGLQQQMLQPFLSNMQKALGNMSPPDLERMREMLRDLNRMLQERAEGREPDFDAFKQKWGDHFPGAENLDQLMEQIAQQSGQMQSMLASMSPGQRRQLQDMMQSLFMQDERLEAELRQLGMNLSQLMPPPDGRRYNFRGDDDLTMKQAMELMDELRQLDELERQIQKVRDPNDLEKIDPEQVEELLGEEAKRDLERLREMTKKLEEAGYLERKGDRLELTARAIRKIGDKALRDIFGHLKRDRFGGHALERRGAGGDRTDQSKPYEFGDPFLLELRETLMNAVERNGAGIPVRLAPADFEVARTETQTHAATVLMLDMSRSMIFNGCFLPAKKVALALNALIRGQFPRDSLYIVGFSLYAREFSAAQLPHLAPGEWSVGTNMHAGFLLARQLLARHKGGNKQVIMITDGEPTAHMEGSEPEFAYPPTRRTLQETLKEVQRCTREDITINTFMLEQSHALTAFVEQMTRINRGRAFFATSDRLGEYVLVDFVRSKRRAVS
ncbi:MAG TPA: VWA domain-containing protein [Methylomirabilota bacterium]|nr:VWA domain-containing protein [Methylomirabilota bacterium]